MRYIMMIKATKDYEAGMPPNSQLMAGMGRLSAEMATAGILLAAEGLQPSSQGVRIKQVDGIRTVTDGPFAETKELVGGYAILQTKSKAHAIELANRAVEVHVAAGVPEVEVELRPLFDPGDFDPAQRQ